MIKHVKLFWSFILASLLVAQAAVAQEVAINVEKAKEAIAKNFDEIMDEAVPHARRAILNGETVAFGIMILSDGRLKKVAFADADKAPPETTTGLIQRSLYALAKKHSIGASGIFYTVVDPKDSKKMILMAELEHAFGSAILRATGYSVENGKVVFGNPVDVNKDFKVFHYTNPLDTDKKD